MNPQAANNDILNNPRYQGALDTISGVTQFFDGIFVMFISFVAFFIISSAVLKNVIAGAYASFPKFFDKVDEAHSALESKVQSRGDTLGLILGFFLRLIPNFKELSEFRDDTVEPKHYFIKAIPQSLGAIMIGVTIYNGQYRDFMSVTSGFGSEMITRILTSVNPIDVFDRIANTAKGPTWATKNDKTDKGEFIREMSKDMYKTVVSYYSDIKTEQAKSKLGKDIEQYAAQIARDKEQFIDKKKYKYSIDVERVLGSPDTTMLDQSQGDITNFIYAKAFSDFQIDSAKHKGDDWYFRIVIRFTKIMEGVKTSGDLNSLKLSVDEQGVSTVENNKIEVKLGEAKNGCKLSIAGPQAKIDGKSFTIVGNTLIIEDSNSDMKYKDLIVQGLFYQVGGRSHRVTIIKLGEAETRFEDLGGKVPSFTWGDAPVIKKD